MRLYSPKEIIDSGLCIGCGSCVAQAVSDKPTMQFDKHGFLKPEAPREWLQHQSEKFTQTCPFSPAAKKETAIANELYPEADRWEERIGKFQSAYVGYVQEEDFRLKGSSGGMVSWVAAELMRRGLIDGVAHVIATGNPQEEGRYFKYRLSKTADEVRQGAKSRYYPIELSQMLKTIRDTPGRYAIVGIPCFIKAVHLLRESDPIFKERIPYTLGLFCGHMKSARFVESFAWQMGVPVNDIQKVEFRYKHPDRPANWYNAALTLRDGNTINRDWWHLADGDWGAGFFMNNACNFCDDVVAETADVSFGDAWVEPYSSDGMGTNVVIVRSALVDSFIQEAISEGRLKLQEVDGKFVADTQAAGFRQRREGLAYRLTWATPKVAPHKRVAPDAKTPERQRKLIYRLRYQISKWSHRMFYIARKMNKPKIYIRWAGMAAAVYHGLAYHKGKLGEITKRFRELSA